MLRDKISTKYSAAILECIWNEINPNHITEAWDEVVIQNIASDQYPFNFSEDDDFEIRLKLRQLEKKQQQTLKNLLVTIKTYENIAESIIDISVQKRFISQLKEISDQLNKEILPLDFNRKKKNKPKKSSSNEQTNSLQQINSVSKLTMLLIEEQDRSISLTNNTSKNSQNPETRILTQQTDTTRKFVLPLIEEQNRSITLTNSMSINDIFNESVFDEKSSSGKTQNQTNSSIADS